MSTNLDFGTGGKCSGWRTRCARYEGCLCIICWWTSVGSEAMTECSRHWGRRQALQAAEDKGDYRRGIETGKPSGTVPHNLNSILYLFRPDIEKQKQATLCEAVRPLTEMGEGSRAEIPPLSSTDKSTSIYVNTIAKLQSCQSSYVLFSSVLRIPDCLRSAHNASIALHHRSD